MAGYYSEFLDRRNLDWQGRPKPTKPMPSRKDPTDDWIYTYRFEDLIAAIRNGHSRTISRILRLYPEFLDMPNLDGRTPLHIAARCGRSELLSGLLRLNHASLDLPNYEGRTPLHIAAACGHISTVEGLLQLGSQSIYWLDTNGMAPLHSATMGGHLSMVKYLLRWMDPRFPIDAQTKDGNTCLHLAVDKGHISIVELLIRLGSQAINWRNRLINWQDQDHYTPMKILISKVVTYRSNDHLKELCQILQVAGASTDFKLSPSNEYKRGLIQPMTSEEIGAIRERIYFDLPLFFILMDFVR